ncbi:MAG: dockerin type I domain-containing protein [Clostridia bacterium]|nr:dockerin type I domain-containing protein [Clostridia bacterium]
MRLRKWMGRTALLTALLLAVTGSAFAAYTYTYAPVAGYTDPEGVAVQTGGEMPWAAADGVLRAGNSGKDNSVSALKVTVTGSGVLQFQYKVSSTYQSKEEGTPADAVTETNPDSLVICAGTEITADTAYSELPADYQRYYGEIDWKAGSVTVTADEGVGTDIFFVYKKNAKTDGGQDCAWVKDLTFTTDTKVTLTVDCNERYGTVTGAGKYEAGAEAKLTAVPKDGCRFYGWVDDAGTFLSDRPEYGVSVNNDMTIRAEFALEGAYEARRGSTFYTSLTEALAANKRSDIFLLKDTTLTEDAEIPSGVTLYIPYEEHYTTDYKNGGVSTEDKITATAYRTLTVEKGVTLTVDGTLRLGAVMGKVKIGYQGHNNGACGCIDNRGTIAVNGTLDSWGLITGSGTVTAVGGGTVYEPFIVCDFAGGSNMLQLYQANITPFKRYAMQNIQCTLVLDSSSTLYGRGCLYGDSRYNEVEIPIAASGGLFQLADGASITRTYDSERQVSAFPGIGRENWTVSGGMTFGALEMDVLGVQISTGKCGFPLPYNLSMTLKNGSYNIPNHLRVMPGAALTVGRKATLTVGGSLYVLDGLKQGSMSGVRYASTEQLKNSSFSACGELTVDGGQLSVAGGAAFGGVVQTTGKGSIMLETGAVLTNTVQDGGKGYYSDNTALFEGFTARANIGGALTALEAGHNYHAVSGAGFTLPSFTVKYVANGESISSAGYQAEVKYATETVTIDQPMTGLWAEGDAPAAEHQITAVNGTQYDAADASRTEVRDAELQDGTLTFAVERKDSAYACLVQVQIGDAAPQTVADVNGVYTVTGVNDDVKIIVTSVLIGDVNLDGAVAADDATAILQYVAKLATLQPLAAQAADANQDGAVAADDSTAILRYIAKLDPKL